MMVNGFGECHKHKKWSTGYKWAFNGYSAALGACEFGTMQDKMLRGQLVEKSSVLCMQEQLLCKRTTVVQYRWLEIAHSPRSKLGEAVGQEDLPQHFAQVLLLFASSSPPKNYTTHCFCFQPGWQECICSLQQVPSQVNKMQTMQ